MSGRPPSQRLGVGSYHRPRITGEESGCRPDEAMNVTWLLLRWRLVQQVGTAIQIRAVKAYIECDGNAKEAAFRAGFNDRTSVASAVRGAIKRVLRAEVKAS